MKMGIVKTLTILLFTSAFCVRKSQQVEAGWAFGMNNYALDQSRQELMLHLQRTLKELALPDYTVPFMGDNHFHNNTFTPAPFALSDADVYFQDGHFYIDIKRFDGRIEGQSWKKNIFGVTERFGFGFEGTNGSMALKITLAPSWEYLNGKKVPLPAVTDVNFRITDSSKIDVAIWTKDVGPLLMDASIQVFKPIFIDVVLPILNGTAMTSVVNGLIQSEMNATKGQMPVGMLEGLLYLIPNNTIQIPDDIFMTYALAQGQPVGIDGGLIYGYYEGEILGLGDRAIQDPKYATPGYLQIQYAEQPFQLQVSASLINNMFEVILGRDVVQVDIPYWIFAANQFPLDFTSTTLEAAVPGLTDIIGFDVPLSARFFNRGAPRFIFTKDEMYVTYDLAVDIYTEDFSKKLFKVHYDNVEVKFDMVLENNFYLNVEWEQVSMESARLEDCEAMFSIRDQQRADQHIMDFFDWSLDFILPWVQATRPPGLCKFVIPQDIPGLVHFESLVLSVEERYLNLGMSPRFANSA